MVHGSHSLCHLSHTLTGIIIGEERVAAVASTANTPLLNGRCGAGETWTQPALQRLGTLQQNKAAFVEIKQTPGSRSSSSSHFWQADDNYDLQYSCSQVDGGCFLFSLLRNEP
eukprot:scpid65133/ scgid25415/ 